MKKDFEHKGKGLTPEEMREAVAKAEKFFVSQKAVLLDEANQKFLVILNADNNKWELPGGLVDKTDKSFSDALEREIFEEIGSDIEYEYIAVTSAHNTRYELNGDSNAVAIIGSVFLYRGGDIILSKEHVEFAWMTTSEIDELSEQKMNPIIKKLIQDSAIYFKQREYLADLQRLQADFSNYRRRQEESQRELRGFLVEKFLVDILPVMDNFRIATGHVPAEQKESPWVTGIGYIEQQLEKVLEENGVTTLPVSVGDVFDPAIHEAVGHENQESSDENQAETQDTAETQQTVAQVLQNGYKIGDRVVRPAKVVVG